MTRRKAPTSTRSASFREAAAAAKPTMSPADQVLLAEACRLIDRLDRFDALLTGEREAWVAVDWPYEDAPATLVVSSVLSEARAHTAELRQVLKALDLPVPKAASGPTKLELMLGGKSG